MDPDASEESIYINMFKPVFWALKISFVSFRGSKSSQKLPRIFRQRGFSFRGAILL
jgi:hypothetical protein